MFSKSAKWYDLLYSFKDYQEEAVKMATDIRSAPAEYYDVSGADIQMRHMVKDLSLLFSSSNIDDSLENFQTAYFI